MDKITYLAELAEGLARWVPERERQDILRYYAEYFEEAGFEREAEVVAELGDPWALSCRLAVEGGFVTQEAANSWTPRQNKRKVWPFVLAGTLAMVLIVGVSAASLAAKVGRLVGRFTADTPVRQATIVEGSDYAWSEPDWDGPYVEYVEGDAVGGFWTMQDGCLEQFDTIDVEVGLANVTVTAADDYTLFISQSEDLNGYELTWEVKGGALKIRDISSGQVNVNSWEDLQNLFQAGRWSMDVSITVPEVLLDKVSIKTGTGNVFLGEVWAKKIEAAAGTGNVECYEPHEVKKLDLESGTGNVFLGMGEMYNGLDIDLESGIGSVEASLGCYERDCAYKLESGLGSVSINGVSQSSKAERRGNTSYKLDAESGTGDVAVNFYDSRWQ